VAEYVFRSRSLKEMALKRPKLIMDFVDLDSDKWKQYAMWRPLPYKIIYGIEGRRLEQYEKRINEKFDICIFVAEREVKIFQERYPLARNLCVVPNGVDIGYFEARPDRSNADEIQDKRGVILFTGVMDYFANVDGVLWFYKEILPRIRRMQPGAQFVIAGKNPIKEIQELGQEIDITVTGYVPDIRNHYGIADVCVAPLRIARGLQNKVLEGMASGRAIVATSNASEGIMCTNGEDIVIVDEPSLFADHVIRLLSDKEERRRLGQNAMETVRRNYSWQENLKALGNVLGDVVR